MRKTRIKLFSIPPIAIGMMCLALLSVGAERPKKDQAPVDQSPSKEPLSVLAKQQPDSPLIITDINVDDSENPRMPTVRFTITNKSDKLILIHALKHEAPFERGGISTSIVGINPDRKMGLEPGQSLPAQFDTSHFNEPLKKLILSVDFVEFADGTRWGDDVQKTGERVDGARAGAKAARDALLQILLTGGANAVIRSLDSISPEPNRSIPRSEEWLSSFRGGVNWMCWRVGNRGASYIEIEKELRRPIDFREERR